MILPRRYITWKRFPRYWSLVWGIACNCPHPPEEEVMLMWSFGHLFGVDLNKFEQTMELPLIWDSCDFIVIIHKAWSVLLSLIPFNHWKKLKEEQQDLKIIFQTSTHFLATDCGDYKTIKYDDTVYTANLKKLIVLNDPLRTSLNTDTKPNRAPSHYLD